MTRKDDNKVLSVVHPVCCGLDVHKDIIAACLVTTDAGGNERYEQQMFSCFTDDLKRMRKWLIDRRCRVVAMESTGVYWHAVFDILEKGFKLLVVNARHIKNVPGRKTDILDSQWLAGLLRHGLLRGSFIPPKEVRRRRDLTRCRRTYVEALADEKRRVHKLFQSANIKIDSVACDLFGVTGRNLIGLLSKSNKKLKLADVEGCLRGSLKKKVKELYRSVQGFLDDGHRFVLKSHMSVIKSLESQIKAIDRRLSKLFDPYVDLLDRLVEIPGISIISAYGILSEVGTTLEDFPSAAHFCSWAGVCPGNNESAGKRRSGRSPVRRSHLKTILIECAWAAVKKKGSYYRSKFYSLRARRGPKRAIMAIAHRLLKAVYAIVKQGAVYRELGENYLALLKKDSRLSYLRSQAKQVGYKLVPIETT